MPPSHLQPAHTPERKRRRKILSSKKRRKLSELSPRISEDGKWKREEKGKRQREQQTHQNPIKQMRRRVSSWDPQSSSVMMGTKREDSKISGSSQKQIQKKLHTKEGAKKGGFDDALKNFWKPSEREDEGKQSEREREENNQPKGYSEDAGNNNKTGKTSQKPQIFEASNGEGQFDTSSQAEDEPQQTRTIDKQKSKRRSGWKEKTKKKGKRAVDYCEGTPLLRDHDDTRKTEGQGITGSSATPTPTSLSKLPSSSTQLDVLVHPLLSNLLSSIIHPSIKMVPLVCHPSLSADPVEMDRQNKVFFFLFLKVQQNTYIFIICILAK